MVFEAHRQTVDIERRVICLLWRKRHTMESSHFWSVFWGLGEEWRGEMEGNVEMTHLDKDVFMGIGNLYRTIITVWPRCALADVFVSCLAKVAHLGVYKIYVTFIEGLRGRSKRRWSNSTFGWVWRTAFNCPDVAAILCPLFTSHVSEQPPFTPQ